MFSSPKKTNMTKTLRTLLAKDIPWVGFEVPRLLPGMPGTTESLHSPRPQPPFATTLGTGLRYKMPAATKPSFVCILRAMPSTDTRTGENTLSVNKELSSTLAPISLHR